MFNFPLFPDQASTLAPSVDYLYFFIIAVTAFFTVLVSLLVAFFAVQYRKSKSPEAHPIHGSLPLEIGWSVIPLAIAMVMFVWSTYVYYGAIRPPAGAMEIYVIGKQWMWKIEHPNGVREINELHVPTGRDVKLIMTSQDVIHDFSIPAFRIKNDVVPGSGRYSILWFRATKPGTYHIFCSQYCGTYHSGMIGHVIAMEPADFERWQSGGGPEGSMAANGEKLFQQYGCISCHTGTAQARGPSLNGLYGSTVNLSDGRTVKADDAYIKESILTSTAKVVAGYQPIMPVFQGQISEEGVLQLLEYVKSLKGGATQTPPANTSTAVPAANLNQAPVSATQPKKQKGQ